MLEISSLQNQRIKYLQKLRKRRQRDRDQLFIIEGYRALKRALDGGFKIDSLFICPELFLGSNEAALLAQAEAAGAELIQVQDAVFRKISYRDRPEGILGLAPQFHPRLEDCFADAPQLLLVAEAIEKPGNLGTMMRTCDAASAGLVICDPTTDIFNANVVRASIGTLFTTPFAEADNEAFLNWAREQGIQTVATTPDTDMVFTDVDYGKPSALIMGTEQYGLSDYWLENADYKVRINKVAVAGISLIANNK